MFMNLPFRSCPLIAKLLQPPFLKQKSYSKMKAIARIFWEWTSAHPENAGLENFGYVICFGAGVFCGVIYLCRRCSLFPP